MTTRQYRHKEPMQLIPSPLPVYAAYGKADNPTLVRVFAFAIFRAAQFDDFLEERITEWEDDGVRALVLNDFDGLDLASEAQDFLGLTTNRDPSKFQERVVFGDDAEGHNL